eukprot:m.215444 g.215444  ORF g.215444 m.215444 type:complete len:90 (-) comp16975_c0_seq3:8-277(-)
MAGNGVREIADGSALQVAEFVSDSSSPFLTGFDFAQDAFGHPVTLTLYFSETVDVRTFDLTKVILQERRAATADTEQLRLTGGRATPVH